MQRRECLPAESVAQITPSVNAAYEKMDRTSVVCAYQVRAAVRLRAAPRHELLFWLPRLSLVVFFVYGLGT